MPEQALIDIGFSADEAKTVKLFKGQGCEKCNNTGYKGRVGLFEVMVIDDDMRELILSGASSYDLHQKATQSGMMSLRDSGRQKIRDGVSSLEEVARETVEA